MARILIVDDDPRTRDTIKRCMISCGHLVATAESGEACLRMLDKDPQLPHLILLDFEMGGMNGIQVLEEIKSKEATWAIPVVMLSGFEDDQLEDDAIGNYAIDFLTKPIGTDALAEKVTSILSQLKGQ